MKIRALVYLNSAIYLTHQLIFCVLRALFRRRFSNAEETMPFYERIRSGTVEIRRDLV